MNGKERLATVILAVTLAVGVLATAVHKPNMQGPVPEAAHRHSSDTCHDSGDTYLRLDINVATLDQLMTLPGIGPAKATAMVEWRKVNGAFTSVDQLVSVKGIGPKTLDRIRSYICVNREAILVGD
jgi:comEA protein